jgi:hypothetical protein
MMISLERVKNEIMMVSCASRQIMNVSPEDTEDPA